LPAETLFLSDVGAELDAAQAAGMRTALCVRRPETARPSGAHQVIRTLDDVP
jgi:enolase-phosphatase E1